MIHAGRPYGELEQAYRRRFWRAMLLSAGIHALLTLLLPPSCIPAPLRPETVGYRKTQRIEKTLAPADFPEAAVRAAADRRLRAGALEWVEFVYDDAPRPARPNRPRPQVRIGEIVPWPATEKVVIQLDENFAPQPTTLPKSRTSNFAIRHMVVPDYPEASLEAGIEGPLRLKARVDPQGSVQEVVVISSAVDVLCEIAAKEALYQWRFHPLTVNDQGIWFSVVVPFRFQVRR
ncbi:MAG: energy transducer TonB [Candidatus Eisenbacteria sp.]|nr:energy transducer TonB [Candidatus Eisenbacteria bacterium]